MKFLTLFLLLLYIYTNTSYAKDLILYLKRQTKLKEVDKAKTELYAKEYITINNLNGEIKDTKCNENYCYVIFDYKGQNSNIHFIFDENNNIITEYKTQKNEDIQGNDLNKISQINLQNFFSNLKQDIEKKVGKPISFKFQKGLYGVKLDVVIKNNPSPKNTSQETQNLSKELSNSLSLSKNSENNENNELPFNPIIKALAFLAIIIIIFIAF